MKKNFFTYLFSNKYYFLWFSLAVFGLRLLAENSYIPASTGLFIVQLKTPVLTTLIISFLYIFSAFVMAYAVKNKPEAWWEDQPRNPQDYSWVKLYFHGLFLAYPLALYGSVLYLAGYASWKGISAFLLSFAVSRYLNYRKDKKNASMA